MPVPVQCGRAHCFVVPGPGDMTGTKCNHTHMNAEQGWQLISASTHRATEADEKVRAAAGAARVLKLRAEAPSAPERAAPERPAAAAPAAPTQEERKRE